MKTKLQSAARAARPGRLTRAATGLVRRSLVLASLILVGFPAAAVAADNAATPEKQTVLYILLDGLRWDSVTPSAAPNLDQLARSGVRGEMIPVWPTISTPNHWALVTGLYPAHSGLFHNDMYDPKTRQFLDPVGGGPFWGRGEPIWSTVARFGGVSGMIGNWAGWRAPVETGRPSWQMPYSAPRNGRDIRASLAVSILDQDPGSRPDLLTLAFVEIDHDQHTYGVGSAEAKAAIRHVDGVIGEFIDGLKARRLDKSVNVIIVSDHGMMRIGQDQVVYLDDIIDLDDLEVRPVGGGPVVALWPKPGMAEAIYGKLRRDPRHIQLYRPGEIPAGFNCCDPAFTPPILVTTDPGWVLMTRKEGGPVIKGGHGYDNRLAEMHALFIAAGPAFRPGVGVAAFPNVDVYPLLARLLKVEARDNDGSIDTLCRILADPPSNCGRSPGPPAGPPSARSQ